MKKSRFSEEQIAYALRQVEQGTSPADVCRQLGVSEATFYVWKKKYAHLGMSELRRLRQLEDENARLKRLVADLTLDKHMLSEALRKKKSKADTSPRARHVVLSHVWGERRARVGLPNSVARAGTRRARRRIRPRCGGAFANWRTRARGSVTIASGCCCVGRAGW